MNKQYHLTQEGSDELRKELDQLIGQRKEVAERIKTAREFGDLSENAEYSAARQEQEKAENRISEIEHILQNLEIIKKSGGEKTVRLGCNVTLISGSKTKELQVVGTVEADPLEGKISDESPIGKALLKKKVGDEVEVKSGGDMVTYKVTAIA
jgi:transcription elongation factor GreA